MKLVYKISVILLFGFLNACERPIGEIKIDQESKDYCLFAPGSYWIYQDSATFEMDSIVINNDIYYDSFRSSGNGHKCETYGTSISLYSYDNISNFTVKLTTGNADGTLLKPCIFIVHHYAIMYHNGEIGEFGALGLVLLERKNSYILNEITYSDVKIFKYSNMGMEKVFYWAKYVGLIREEIYTNDSISVKNLIKYNVNPYNQ